VTWTCERACGQHPAGRLPPRNSHPPPSAWGPCCLPSIVMCRGQTYVLVDTRRRARARERPLFGTLVDRCPADACFFRTAAWLHAWPVVVQGRLSFTTFHGGEYQVCVSLNSSRGVTEPLVRPRAHLCCLRLLAWITPLLPAQIARRRTLPTRHPSPSFLCPFLRCRTAEGASEV
jgi:hypothetical protein